MCTNNLVYFKSPPVFWGSGRGSFDSHNFNCFQPIKTEKVVFLVGRVLLLECLSPVDRWLLLQAWKSPFSQFPNLILNIGGGDQGTGNSNYMQWPQDVTISSIISDKANLRPLRAKGIPLNPPVWWRRRDSPHHVLVRMWTPPQRDTKRTIPHHVLGATSISFPEGIPLPLKPCASRFAHSRVSEK